MATVAWQGWRLDLPPRWHPQKLDGDYAAGYAAFADLLQQRLGLRWKKLGGKKFDPADWARQALRDEVGQLAADEAKPVAPPPDGEWSASLLYTEPEPPGRDLWVGYSARSQRAVVLSYHTRHRDRMLGGSIVPTVCDWPADQPMPWAVFELSCVVPAGFELLGQRLNAGDLSLTFGDDRRQELVVRQVAVATLALARMPLEKWLGQQHSLHGRYYRAVGRPAEAKVEVLDARELAGVSRSRVRRRRHFYMRRLPRTLAGYALHDVERDRLVILEGTDEALVREVAKTVGWARSE